MFMKQIILLAIVVLPFITMAQTRPAPSKAMEANKELKGPINSQPFTYIIMEVVPMAEEKKNSRFKLNFEANDKALGQQFNNMSGKFNRVIDVLGVMGSRGAELVAKDGNFYYFKMKMSRSQRK